MKTNEALVLGAGVSGLSTSILLLQAGHAVTIWAKDLPPNTTSNQAAAVWFPYLCQPREKAGPWAKYSLQFFKEYLVPDPASGCRMTTIYELFDQEVGEPWWAAAVDRYAKIDRAKLPHGYVDGYEVESVVIDTSIYMDYLVDWFRRLGGELIQKEIKDISEALAACDLVVNCTGLGSRDLFNDQSLYPVRGQTIKIRSNGFKDSIVDDEAHNQLGYIIPRTHDIVLGGTAQENDWELAPRAADRAEILRKAAELDPRFAQVEILSEGAGLRPVRPTVRLEAERIGAKTVIHNYGHGGAGFTLSWGCAAGVLNTKVNCPQQD
jgi:D-amino-acid oxidase